MVGRIRIGRKINSHLPQYSNFTPIVLSTRHPLSSFNLKDSHGYILENIWQFSKIYQTVPYAKQFYSLHNKMVIWEHYPETHLKVDGDGKPIFSSAYIQWRRKGYHNPHAIRYPTGFNYRTKTLGHVWGTGSYNCETEVKILHVDEARQTIFLPLYCQLVSNNSEFKELISRLKKGENLLLIDADGPYQESLKYYMKKYGVNEKFIEDDTMEASIENINILLNDDKHIFGNASSLAYALTHALNNPSEQ